MWELLCRWRGRRRFPSDWCFHERFLLCCGCVGIRRGWRAARIWLIALKRSKLSISPNSAALKVNEIIPEHCNVYQWLNISKLFNDLLLCYAPTMTTWENTNLSTEIMNWLSHTDCWPQSDSLINSLQMADFVSGGQKSSPQRQHAGILQPWGFWCGVVRQKHNKRNKKGFKDK